MLGKKEKQTGKCLLLWGRRELWLGEVRLGPLLCGRFLLLWPIVCPAALREYYPLQSTQWIFGGHKSLSLSLSYYAPYKPPHQKFISGSWQWCLMQAIHEFSCGSCHCFFHSLKYFLCPRTLLSLLLGFRYLGAMKISFNCRGGHPTPHSMLRRFKISKVVLFPRRDSAMGSSKEI